MAVRIRESEIERVARAAQERGMSYGRFVALGLEAPEKLETAPVKPRREVSGEPQKGEKRCANEQCGKIFYSDNPRTKYCCIPCRSQQMWENQKKRGKEA